MAPLGSLLLGAATMLRAGVLPAQLWQQLSRMHPGEERLRVIAARVDEGAPVPLALAGPGQPTSAGLPTRDPRTAPAAPSTPAMHATANAAADAAEWRVVAAAWAIAERVGAPLSPVLARLGVALTEIARVRDRRRVVLAAPRASMRLVCALPLVSLLFGGLLGFDPARVLTTPFGALLAAAGLALIAAGYRASARMLARSVGRERVAGVAAELVWVALGGGLGAAAALQRAFVAADAFAPPAVRPGDFLPGGEIARILAQAEALGVPPREFLLAHAEAERREVWRQLEEDAERLGVRMLLPLGLYILPAFLLLGVAPVVLSMLGALL